MFRFSIRGLQNIVKFQQSSRLHNAVNKAREAATKKFFIRENIPPIALIVGCVALTFQVAVLYPWHETLSDEFNELRVSSLVLYGVILSPTCINLQ